MKSLSLILALLGLSVLQQSGNSLEINDRTAARFPLESARITYTITGDAIGTATLLFDRNGWRAIELRTVTLKRYGLENTEQTVELTDGDYTFTANLNTMKGRQKRDNKWSALRSYRETDEVVSALMTGQGGVLTDAGDTILGKPCRIWTFAKGTTASISEWSGIPLKIVKRLPSVNYVIAATAIDTTVVTSDADFELSSEILFE